MSALVARADEDEQDESAKTLEEGSKRQTVPKFCATRWSAKVTTLSALLAKYGSVLLALDEILSSSSGDAKRDASAYSRLLQDSEFRGQFQPNKRVYAIINRSKLKQKASVWFVSLMVSEGTFYVGVKTKRLSVKKKNLSVYGRPL